MKSNVWLRMVSVVNSIAQNIALSVCSHYSRYSKLKTCVSFRLLYLPRPGEIL